MRKAGEAASFGTVLQTYTARRSSSTAARSPFPPGEGIWGRELVGNMERNASLKGFSQKLRKEMTKEESLLWYNFLRKHPVRFRRQYIIGNYILDFYCHQAKLAIELDGSQHYDPKAIEKDQERTDYLKTQGIQVLRFTNLEVLQQFSAVCEAVDNIIRKQRV